MNLHPKYSSKETSNHNKELRKSFLGIFDVHIYSEDRTDGKGLLYKHFLKIRCCGFTVFSTFWKTGTVEGKVNRSGFYSSDT